MPYRSNISTRRIEWGECDPAGIVFYPNFFAMFDNATTLLFSAALGMTKFEFLAKYDCAGYPMVDTRARFLAPARFGDDVTIETAITAIKRSSFEVTHQLKNNGVLAVEYYSGEEFSHAIARATYHRDDAHLLWRLKALAYFLATVHDRTAIEVHVDFDADCTYFDTVAGRLRKAHRIGQDDVDELSALRDRWRDNPQMWQDQQVWLHGDATPANFLFGDGLDVAAIDLERMKRGDRMFDVGRVAGELQHAFMRDTGDRHRAEPFIEHFFREYSRHFPDSQHTLESVKARAPYYMALNLLRIARNDYIDGYYGGRLVRQAKRLLKAA